MADDFNFEREFSFEEEEGSSNNYKEFIRQAKQKEAFKEYVNTAFDVHHLFKSPTAREFFKQAPLSAKSIETYDNHQDNYDRPLVRSFYKWYEKDNNKNVVHLFIALALEKEHQVVESGHKSKSNFQFHHYLSSFNNDGIEYFRDIDPEHRPEIPEKYGSLIARMWNVWIRQHFPSDAGLDAATRRMGKLNKCPACHSIYDSVEILEWGPIFETETEA